MLIWVKTKPDKTSDRTQDMVLDEAIKLLENEARRRNALFQPYPKQLEFFNAGKTHRERMLSAGNQQGKSVGGLFEAACHLTGIYPDWWDGKRFNRPINAWAIAETAELSRDSLQKKLLDPESGLLHLDHVIESVGSGGGVKGALDYIKVRHISGGISTLTFKTYRMGRERLQAATLDLAFLDEEPPWDIYEEILSRTNAVPDACIYTMFTPLNGTTALVKRFFNESSPDRYLSRMTINDALHIPAEQRQRIIDSYPEHQRKARVEGIPVMGSGLIFPVNRSDVTERPIQIPDHWARLCAMDFGWTHPTAAVWIAHDRDTDTVHLYDCYRKSEADVATNASAIRKRGEWIPVAWPHDGLQHQKGEGHTLADMYRAEGLNMLGTDARFEDGRNSVEAGIMMMLDRIKTGRLKVAAHLEDWFEEFMLYHRKDGIIHKEKDDLMDATRYAIMMLRFAQSQTEHDFENGDYEEEFVGNRSIIGGY